MTWETTLGVRNEGLEIERDAVEVIVREREL